MPKGQVVEIPAEETVPEPVLPDMKPAATVEKDEVAWFGVSMTNQKNRPMALFVDAQEAVRWARWKFGKKGWSVKGVPARVRAAKGEELRLSINSFATKI